MIVPSSASFSRLIPAGAPRSRAPVPESLAPRQGRSIPAKCGADLQGLNFSELGSYFARFAERLSGVIDVMRNLRPDIANAEYEVIHDAGRLKVVDSKLDKRATIWLEESFNGDPELVKLAAQFNDQVVRTFDTERGRWDEQGVFHKIGDGYGDNGWGRDYSGLASTVGRTTKFLSLLNDVSSYEIRPWDDPDPFFRTAIYMEKYIEKDIIQYQPGAAGSVDVVRSIKGPSMFGWVDMVG